MGRATFARPPREDASEDGALLILGEERMRRLLETGRSLVSDFDTDSIPNTTVRAGESICAVWTGGVVGSVARMTVIYDEVAY